MKFFTFIMGLAEIIHKSFGEFIEYEKHSVLYATLSTAAGIVGGAAAGVYAATAYAANALYTSLAAIGGYAVSRGVVGVITHLGNIYNLLIGKYSNKNEAKSVAGNLAPAPAT